MEYIMMAINMNWVWLGPWLVISLGTALVALLADLFQD